MSWVILIKNLLVCEHRASHIEAGMRFENGSFKVSEGTKTASDSVYRVLV